MFFLETRDSSFRGLEEQESSALPGDREGGEPGGGGTGAAAKQPLSSGERRRGGPAAPHPSTVPLVPSRISRS